MTRRWPFIVALLVGALLLASCGRDVVRHRWERALLEADSMVDVRRYADARRAYATLQESPDRDATHPSLLRYVQYRLAFIDELDGRYEAAIAGYRGLWSDGAHDEMAGRAMFRAGYTRYVHMERLEEGLELWEQTMRAMPDTVGAGKALWEVLSHYTRQGQDAEGLRFVERLYGELSETAIGDNLLYRYAQQLKKVGRSEDAEAAFLAVVANHAEGGLVDNAQWELAELYQELGRYEEALSVLKIIADNTESSWFIGSYDSEYVDDALFTRGMIYLEQLQRYGEAEEEFRVFLDTFPESLLRDDARWNIVQSRLAQADADGARDSCADLARREPESRWVDDCEAIVAALQRGQEPRALRTPAAD